MKKIIFPLVFAGLFQLKASSQLKMSAMNNQGFNKFLYGVRAGVNISTITNSATLDASSRVGLIAGFLADGSFGKNYGLREELSYIRSGFKYKKINSEGTVHLQYVYLTSLFAFNFGKILQLQLGPQTGVLMNAVADSINRLDASNVRNYFSVNNKTNRLIYGGCAGLEIYPYKGFLFGVRYNLSSSFIKTKGSNGEYPYGNGGASRDKSNSSLSKMWQITVGWRFGCGINE